MRDELLRGRGWLVVTIPFYEWDKLGSLAARTAYLHAKLPSSLLQHDLPAVRKRQDHQRGNHQRQQQA